MLINGLIALISEFCEQQFEKCTVDKLKKDLTSKCGEERRAMVKK